MMFDLEMILQI